MSRLFLSLLAAATVSLAAAPAAAIDPSPVVEAERAFAADGLTMGIQPSFLKHSAPEGIIFNPDPARAKAVFAEPAPKGPTLVWWPLWAGIARSGDLGFTSGPYAFEGGRTGWYFTVWARQPDGSWRWLFDGGPPADAARAAPKDSPVAYARLASGQAGSAARAMDEVAKAEAALAATARTDVKSAFLAVVADDGRITGSKAPPPLTRAAIEAELATRPTSIAFAPLGGQASAAGDLVWTYGTATWKRADSDRRGHYVRIWRRDAAGWRLLFDELLAVPAAAS